MFDESDNLEAALTRYRAACVKRFFARPDWPLDAQYQMGDLVEKKGRAKWRGKVVGWYRTELTALGYAIESMYETGSVQIYPETALVRIEEVE